MSETSVSVVMGSKSDWPIMKEAVNVLKGFGIVCEVRILSAHRVPDEVATFAKQAAERGVKVIIAGAGWAAHLAGAIAANTVIPVIGIPIDSSPLQGWDALLSTVQMPPGIPVATVSIGKGGAKNAAYLAAQILALSDETLREKLKSFREEMKQKIQKDDLEIQNS